MYKILTKKLLTPLICYMELEAPRIACSAQPGQFLIVRISEKGERIPLTICDYNPPSGMVAIVTQIVGASSYKICALNEGDYIENVVGPLGRPSDFMELSDEQLKEKKYLFIAGGVGAAPVYPQVKYLFEKGAKVDVILGARNKDLIILEEELKKVSSNLYVCTDDGSKGEKGVVTNVMERLVAEGNSYDMSVAIGPMIMMKFASLCAKKLNIPITVSLNSIMVDGTGMCGACRVSVAGQTKFACVDGPEFNGYDVDYDEAMRRSRIYSNQEREADATMNIESLLKR